MDIFERLSNFVLSGRASRAILPFLILLVACCAMIAIIDYQSSHQPTVLVVGTKEHSTFFQVSNCASLSEAKEVFVNSPALRGYKKTMDIPGVTIESPEYKEADGSFIFSISYE